MKIRLRRAPAPAPAPDIPPGTSYMVDTKGGAVVAVHPYRWHGNHGCVWSCFGCDSRGSDGGPWTGVVKMPVVRSAAVTAANAHARYCHVKPKGA